jgi:integrase/recombinase XerD
MLRHTAARLHLKSGGTLEETHMLLRHVHIETTLIYRLNSNAFDNKISKHLEDYIFLRNTGETVMKTNPLKQLIEMYLKQLKLSENTIKSYRFALKYYVMYLKEHKIKYPKTRDIIQFRNERFELGFSVAYNHIFMSAIKGFYQYLSLHSSNLIIGDTYAYDIAKPIKQIQMKHHVTKKVLTVTEARHFLFCTKKFRRDIHHYRDHAIITLMLTSGLSPDEIIHARKSNFKYREGQKTLFVNKKRAMRYQYKIELSFQTYLALRTYVLKRGDTNPYLFMSHRQVGETKHLSRTLFRDMFRRNLKACSFDE